MSKDIKLRMWAEALRGIIKEYPGRTVENVLGNIETRLELSNN